MRHRVWGIALVVALVGPATASAGTVRLDDWQTGNFAANAPWGGGPFKATPLDGPLGQLGTEAFLTFCLEFNEHFNYGNTFDYVLSDNALLGGVGGALADGTGDPVSDATRWLYYQARFGDPVSLVGGFGGSASHTGKYFQLAIWRLEEEKTDAELNQLGTLGSIAIQLANHALALNPELGGGEWLDLEAQGHRVYAMNLTNSTTGVVKQDQLAYLQVAVAEPGTLAQLLAVAPVGILGYVGVAASRFVRRRRRS